MDRWVSARQRVEGDEVALRELLVLRLPELLQASAGMEPSRPDGDGSFLLELESRAGILPLTKQVRVRLAPVRTAGHWTRIGMTWEGTGGSRPLFPVFQGAVELQPIDSHGTELAIIGHYDPPLGPLGTLADVSGLHQSAQTTVSWMVNGLAEALSSALGNDVALPRHEPHRLLVREVMRRRPPILHEEDSLRQGAHTLLGAGLDGAPVVDADETLVGVLSIRDLLQKVVPAPGGMGRKAREAQRHHEAVTVGDAGSRPARTTEADTRLRDAAALMVEHDVGRLVVLDGAKIVGMVTQADAITALVRSDEGLLEAVEWAMDGFVDSVTAAVSDGVVRLVGSVPMRSLHRTVVARVRDLDGVVDVDEERLAWEQDDVTPGMRV